MTTLCLRDPLFEVAWQRQRDKLQTSRTPASSPSLRAAFLEECFWLRQSIQFKLIVFSINAMQIISESFSTQGPCHIVPLAYISKLAYHFDVIMDVVHISVSQKLWTLGPDLDLHSELAYLIVKSSLRTLKSALPSLSFKSQASKHTTFWSTSTLSLIGLSKTSTWLNGHLTNKHNWINLDLGESFLSADTPQLCGVSIHNDFTYPLPH